MADLIRQDLLNSFLKKKILEEVLEKDKAMKEWLDKQNREGLRQLNLLDFSPQQNNAVSEPSNAKSGLGQATLDSKGVIKRPGQEDIKVNPKEAIKTLLNTFKENNIEIGKDVSIERVGPGMIKITALTPDGEKALKNWCQAMEQQAKLNPVAAESRFSGIPQPPGKTPTLQRGHG